MSTATIANAAPVSTSTAASTVTTAELIDRLPATVELSPTSAVTLAAHADFAHDVDDCAAFYLAGDETGHRAIVFLAWDQTFTILD